MRKTNDCDPSLQVTTEAAKTAWEGTKNAWEKAAPLREKVAENEVVQQGVAQVKEGWRSLVSWVNPGAGAAGGGALTAHHPCRLRPPETVSLHSDVAFTYHFLYIASLASAVSSLFFFFSVDTYI